MIRQFFATAGLTAVLMATTWADSSTARPQGAAADEQPGVAFTWSSGDYTYDAASNITRIGQNGDGKINTYRYDPASRLVEGTAHTATYRNAQTFIYDPFGNIKSIETLSTPDVGTAQSDSRVFSVDSQRNRITGGTPCGAVPDCFDYDTSGNQIAGPGGAHYSFDALGAMTDLYGPLRHERYLYDANGERIATLVSPGTPVEQRRYSVRDLGGRVVREIAASISTDGLKYRWTKDYVHRAGALLAAVTPTDSGGERRTHFHLDHLGTPRFITDDAGARLAAHVYSPFGEEAAGSDADGERRKFTGHERDFGILDQPDLDYMHARFYAPNWGRFLSVDPGGFNPKMPQSWNRYAYALNNAVKNIDLDGKEVFVVVTNIVVEDTTVNSRGGGAGNRETVPAYRIAVMGESGYVDEFAGSRDSNFTGKTTTTRGEYGTNHEAPPGTYFGTVRTDGKKGERIELGDKKGGNTITAPDGTKRSHVQIHIGPGCSQGCVLLPGGKKARNAFANSVKFMQEQERAAGRSDQIKVIIQPRNTQECSGDHCDLKPK